MIAGTLTYLLGIDRRSYEAALRQIEEFERRAEGSTGPPRRINETTEAYRRLQAQIRGIQADYRQGNISQERAARSLRQLSTEALVLRPRLEDDARAFGMFSNLMSQASSAADRLEGRLNRLSFANQLRPLNLYTRGMQALQGTLAGLLAGYTFSRLAQGVDAASRRFYEGELALKLYVREMANLGNEADASLGHLQVFAASLRTTPEALAAPITQLIRYTGDFELSANLLRIGAASALAAGRDVQSGAENIAQAIISENSQMLNSIGIAGNLSTAYRRFAREQGRTVESLSNGEKALAAYNFLLGETQGELDALEANFDGLGGAINAYTVAQDRAARAVGQEFEPAMVALYEAGAKLYELFGEDIVPVLAEKLVPLISQNVEGFTNWVTRMVEASDAGEELRGSMVSAILPVAGVGKAILGTGQAAISGANFILGFVAGVGGALGTLSVQLDSYLDRVGRALQVVAKWQRGDIIGAAMDYKNLFGDTLSTLRSFDAGAVGAAFNEASSSYFERATRQGEAALATFGSLATLQGDLEGFFDTLVTSGEKSERTLGDLNTTSGALADTLGGGSGSVKDGAEQSEEALRRLAIARQESNRAVRYDLQLLGEYGETLAEQAAAERVRIQAFKDHVAERIRLGKAIAYDLELLGEYGKTAATIGADEQVRFKRNREWVTTQIALNRAVKEQLRLLGEYGPNLLEAAADERVRIKRIREHVQAQIALNEVTKRELELTGEFGPSAADAAAAERARARRVVERRIEHDAAAAALEYELELLGEYGPSTLEAAADERVWIRRIRERTAASLEAAKALEYDLYLLGEYGETAAEQEAARRAGAYRIPFERSLPADQIFLPTPDPAASAAARAYAAALGDINAALGVAAARFAGLRTAVWGAFNERQIDAATRDLRLAQIGALELGAGFESAANSASKSANSIVSGVGRIAQSIQLLSLGGDTVAQLGNLFDGLEDVAKGLASGGPLDLAQGLVTAGATALLGPGAGGLVGQIFDLARTVGQTLSDLFSGQSPASRALSEGIKNAVTSGITDALNRFRRGEIDRSELRRSIEASIGDAIFNATINALIQGALVEGALKPILDEIGAAALAGDTRRIEQLVAQIPGILDRVLPYILDAAEQVGRTLERYGLGPERQSPSTMPSSYNSTVRYPTTPSFDLPSSAAWGAIAKMEYQAAEISLQAARKLERLATEGVRVTGTAVVRDRGAGTAAKLRLVGS